jgi:hypothetical protein
VPDRGGRRHRRKRRFPIGGGDQCESGLKGLGTLATAHFQAKKPSQPGGTKPPKPNKTGGPYRFLLRAGKFCEQRPVQKRS